MLPNDFWGTALPFSTLDQPSLGWSIGLSIAFVVVAIAGVIATYLYNRALRVHVESIIVEKTDELKADREKRLQEITNTLRPRIVQCWERKDVNLEASKMIEAAIATVQQSRREGTTARDPESERFFIVVYGAPNLADKDVLERYSDPNDRERIELEKSIDKYREAVRIHAQRAWH